MNRFGKSREKKRLKLFRFMLLFGWVLSLCSPLPLRAQNAIPQALGLNSSASTNSLITAQSVTTASVRERLLKAQTELDALRRVDPVGANVAASLDRSMRESLLERLVRLYDQQISYIAEIDALKKRSTELALEAKSWSGFNEPRPYSILLSDGLRESIQVERSEIAQGESGLNALADLTEEHRTTLRQSEENLRQLNEKLESGKNNAEAATLTLRRELERLRSQSSLASVNLLDLERKVRQERLAASRIRLALLERQLLMARADVVFTESDMQAITKRLDDEGHALEQELNQAKSRRDAALTERNAVEDEWRRLRAQPETNSAALLRIAETKELRRTQLEAGENACSLLQFMLQVLTAERVIWDARFAGYQNRMPEAIRDTQRRVDQFRRRINLWGSFYRDQLASASGEVALQEARIGTLSATPEIAALARERLGVLRERDQLSLRALRYIDRSNRLVQRAEEDLIEAGKSLPFFGRLRNALADSKSLFGRLWGLELFTAQDTIVVDGQKISGTRSVTLGKIMTALLIVLVGYWLTGLISRVTEPVVIARFKIESRQARLIRRWVRVVLVSSLVLFSLAWVKIPLTAFAFAGGALMIALGFGLQTLLKNFVSGVIILFERPFRVGDVLDVAGQRGTLSSIGIRSSILQLFDNTEMLIPNSVLLESSITNWTYSNRKVRFTVNVGVAYGSDTRRVVQLLNEIAERHGLVEKDPQPQVFFADFGESALMFEIRFWTDVLKANAAQVASDLRQMIATTFAEQRIVIAYPQRDIHINAAQPFQVQVMPASNAPVKEAPAESKGIPPQPAADRKLDGKSASSKSELASALP